MIKGDATKTIPDFLSKNRHLMVSLLFLDFDLYEPTKVAIQQFLPRMPKGAVLAFDELDNPIWPGETQAALAQITTKGKTTSAASTQLKGVLAELMTPTSKSAMALRGLGFASGAAAVESLGLQGTLQALEGSAAKSGIGVNALFGSVEAGAAVLDLTGSNAQAFTDKLVGMENASGNTEAALAKVNEGWQRQVDLLKSQGTGILRDIGIAILPTLTSALTGVNRGLSAFLEGFKLEPDMGFLDRIQNGLGNLSAELGPESFVGRFADTLVTALQPASSAWSSFIEGFQAARADAMDPLSSAILGLGDALSALGLEGIGETVSNFAAGLSQARDVISGTRDSVTSTNPEVQRFGDAILGLKDRAQELWDKLQPLGQWAVDHKESILKVAAAVGVFAILTGGAKSAVAAATPDFFNMDTTLKTLQITLAGLQIFQLVTGLMKAHQAATVTMTAAQQGLNVAMAANPLGLIVIAIVAVIAAVVLLKRAWDTNFGGIQEKTAAVFAAVGAWIDSAKKWFDELVGRFKAGDWGGIASQIIGSLSSGVTGSGGALVSAFRSLIQRASDTLARVDWGQVGATVVGLLASGLVAAVGLIATAAVAIAKGLWGIIQKTDWGGLANDVLTLLARGLVASVSIIAGAAVQIGKMVVDTVTRTDWGRLARDVLGAIGSAFLSLDSAMAKIGQDILAGLTNGLRGAWGGLVERLRGLVDMLPQVVRQLLGITSPSRVFAEIGMAIMLGLALGITAGGGTAVAAMEKATTDLVAAGNDTRFRDLFAKQFEGVPSVIAWLEDQWKHVNIGKWLKDFGQFQIDWKALAGDPDKAMVEWKRFSEWAVAEENVRYEASKAALDKLNTPGMSEQRWEWLEGVYDQLEADHKKILKNLTETVGGGLEKVYADWKAAQEEINRLLQIAQERTAEAQAAAEAREDLVNAGVLEHMDNEARRIEARRTAEDTLNRDILAGLAAQKLAADDRHKDAMDTLSAERGRWDEYLRDQEAGVKRITDHGKDLEVQLGRLKLDLNLDAEQQKLTELQRRVSDFEAALGKLDVAKTGREAQADKAKAARERIALTTEAQRRMLESVKGTLTGEDARTAELLMQGHALKAQTVRDLMERIKTQLQGQVDAQQDVIDGKQAQIDGLQREIDLNKQLADEAGQVLEHERARVAVILAGIDEREKAETERYNGELGRIEDLVRAEGVRHQTEVDALAKESEALEEARRLEATRHTDRMREIGEEFAMRLFLLNHTQEEAEAMVKAAAEQARQIAAEAAVIWQHSLDTVTTSGRHARAAFIDISGAVREMDAAIIHASASTELLATNASLVATNMERATVAAFAFGDALAQSASFAGGYKMPSGIPATGETRTPNFTGKQFKLNREGEMVTTGAFTVLRGRQERPEKKLEVGFGNVVTELQTIAKILETGFARIELPPYVGPITTPNEPGPGGPVIPGGPTPIPGQPGVTVEQGTIESVTLGDVVVGDTHLYVDGKEVARAIAAAFVEDVTILDQLGKALGERKAQKGRP